jgi:hypothetical protein
MVTSDNEPLGSASIKNLPGRYFRHLTCSRRVVLLFVQSLASSAQNLPHLPENIWGKDAKWAV